MRDTVVRSLCFVTILAVGAQGQKLNENLVQNGGFESGLQNWTVVDGAVSVIGYTGTNGYPDRVVREAIDGGQGLVRGVTFPAVIRQVVDLSKLAKDIDNNNLAVDLLAALGGSGGESGRTSWRARFFDRPATGTPKEIQNVVVYGPGPGERNFETGLVWKAGRFEIRAGARTMWLECRADSGNLGTHRLGFADRMSAVLVRPKQPGARTPLDTELLPNGNFESGRITLPTSRGGWYVQSGRFRTMPYGGDRPSRGDASKIGGREFCLRSLGGTAGMNHWVDLSGNAADLRTGLSLVVSGAFGGYASEHGHARIRVFCFKADRWTEALAIGSVSVGDRNHETRIMRRRGVLAIPPGAQALRILVECVAENLGNHQRGVADVLSARLTKSPPTAMPLRLDQNLLDRADFPSLELTNASPKFGSGWQVASGARFTPVPYGAVNRPSDPFAKTIGGGLYFVEVSTWVNNPTVAFQSFDVSAHRQQIDNCELALRLAGYFGAVGTQEASPELVADFYDSKGVRIPRGFSLGRVSAKDRSNRTTMVRRDGQFLVPTGTHSIVVSLRMHSANLGNQRECFADNLYAGLVRGRKIDPNDRLVSSNQEVWAYPVTGALDVQLRRLNQPPPLFSDKTWKKVDLRRNDSHRAKPRSFHCDDRTVDRRNAAYVSALHHLPNADEVTYDNCKSAFYRVTFKLEDGFRTVVLHGVANVDDLAVLWLNGKRISGAVPVARSAPHPYLDKDLLDAGGLRVLTWPTRDSFYCSDKTLFKAGTNELVFAVCGDASVHEPTGLEFEGRLMVDSPAWFDSDVDSLFANQGGRQRFTLSAPRFANRTGVPYVVLGSLSGSHPGMPLRGREIPLILDPYFAFALANPNRPPLIDSARFLNDKGLGYTTLVVPPSAALKGLQFWHAALVGPLDGEFLVSNPVVLGLR